MALGSTENSDMAGGRGASPRYLWVTAAVLLVVGLTMAGVYRWYLDGTASGNPLAAGGQLRVGSPAPDFQVPRLDGSTVRLQALRGQPVWINFWATWCTPCREEMPDLVEVARSSQSEGVVMLAIDVAEQPGDVKAFLKDGGYESLPVALDRTGDVSSAYRVYGFPTHVFIDRQGIVRKINVGAMSAADMRLALKDLR